MAYHDDLLSQAVQLVHSAPSTQASLRRAVSSAYYAVFHHGIMRTASNRLSNTREFPFTGEDPQVVASLRFVALSFTQLQEDRNFADYDLTEELGPTDALNQVKSAEKIFHIWRSIVSDQIAQEYLVSLVVKHRINLGAEAIDSDRAG